MSEGGATTFVAPPFRFQGTDPHVPALSESNVPLRVNAVMSAEPIGRSVMLQYVARDLHRTFDIEHATITVE